MRRTKEDAAETARQILEAAQKLFLDSGYDNVSLDEIAAAAGVTRGAIHWHFKNKQGLLLALRHQAIGPFEELAENMAACPGKASLSRFNSVVFEVLCRLQKDPRQQGLSRCMLRLDIALAENNPDCGKTFRQELHAIFARIFRSVERDCGLPPPWNADSAASALYAAVDGIFVSWALGVGTVHLVPDGQLLLKSLFEIWENHGA